ncbi:methyltransferase [Nisaea sp.]|uniref:tRNA1(Val) (adenine(37)-N6)-methyltransferase n=1 Tax=Nisaea sp. TaxID=2024842 RepID=UPI0032986D4F
MSNSARTDVSPAAVTEDSLLGGRVRFLQPVEGYRAAVDPVLLAASAPAQDGDRVLDLGCGAGAISLCLLARVPGLTVTGIEQAPEMLDLAERNAVLNGATDRFKPHLGQVEARPPQFEQGAFDLVLANPPYLETDRADVPESALKAAAHVEGEVPLTEWIEAAFRALCHKGKLAMVHRADRLGDLLEPIQKRFGGIEVHPLYSKPGRDAKRVIVMARKGVRTPLSLSSGLVLHNMDGSYSPPVAAALDGAALALGEPL